MTKHVSTFQRKEAPLNRLDVKNKRHGLVQFSKKLPHNELTKNFRVLLTGGDTARQITLVFTSNGVRVGRVIRTVRLNDLT